MISIRHQAISKNHKRGPYKDTIFCTKYKHILKRTVFFVFAKPTIKCLKLNNEVLKLSHKLALPFSLS